MLKVQYTLFGNMFGKLLNVKEYFLRIFIVLFVFSMLDISCMCDVHVYVSV